MENQSNTKINVELRRENELDDNTISSFDNNTISSFEDNIRSQEAMVLENKIKSILKELDQVNQEIEKISDIKTQIFSVLAMVFGVVALIQVDMGMAKGFFCDMITSLHDTFHAPYYVYVGLLVLFFCVQMMFVIFIMIMVKSCFFIKK